MWGIVITGFAFIVGNISTTVVEGINKIGSAFYGPVLAAFLVGVLSKRATTIGVFAGVLAGVGFNLFLWIAVPGVFWIWWNLFGLIIAVIITFIVSLITAAPKPEQIENYTLEGSGMFKQERQWIKIYALLFGYFVFILVFMMIIQKLF